MTDESQVLLFPRGNSRNNVVWVRAHTDVPPLEQDKYSASVRFWAGASVSGKTRLFFYDGNLNGKMYRDILTKALPEIKNLMGTRNWTFVHDGASAHKDEKTNDWLEENVPHYIKSGPDCDWPARSPDLNYIENLFGILADGMSEGDPVQTVEELKAKLEAVWANIPIETLQACVAGVYCAVLV